MRWIALLAAAAWCSTAAAQPATSPASPTPDNPDLAALVGKAAPAIQLTGLDGKQHSLSDYPGNVIVLDFWGTFCVPCKKAMPHLDALAKQLADKGLTVLAVNEGATAADAQKFVSDIQVTLPILLDPNTTAGNAYAVDGLPETVIVGRDGKIRNVFDQGDDQTELAIDQAIRDALGVGVPASQPSAGREDGVKSLLARVSAAYLNLATLQVAGTIDAHADINGEVESHHAEFSAAFNGPGQFKHEVTGDVVAATSGGKLYVFLPAESVFFSGDAPTARGVLDDLAAGAGPLLRTQDLSLALALSDDPARDLTAGATSVSLASPEKIGDQDCPTLNITMPTYAMLVAFDPATYLVRRVTLDLSSGLAARGAAVKTAISTVDFARTITAAPPAADQLAFVLPPTASEYAPEAADANALTGKPAPDFKLTGLDGKVVTSGQLRGSVYILDFWATWCGPCRMSLPGLDSIYKSKKAAGLKVFAVDEMEDQQAVTEFVAETGLSIPVLLDSENSAGAEYGAQGIPETVLVGRDGIVRQVFIGAGNEEAIAAQVDAALGK
jgi:cytochrome c biogenesis protein CcmG/thiol:disulfide interchange protein DsbE